MKFFSKDFNTIIDVKEEYFNNEPMTLISWYKENGELDQVVYGMSFDEFVHPDHVKQQNFVKLPM